MAQHFTVVNLKMMSLLSDLNFSENMTTFFELFFVLLFLIFVSYCFIQIVIKNNYLKEPKVFILNCIILVLILVISNIGHSNLPLSMSLSSLIGPLIGSYTSGSLAIAFYFKFNWTHFYKNYLAYLSMGMTAPLLVYLISDMYFKLN